MKSKDSPRLLVVVGASIGTVALLLLILWVRNGLASDTFTQNMHSKWAIELLPFLLTCVGGGYGSGIAGVIRIVKRR